MFNDYKKSILLLGLLIGVLAMTVAFAALSTNLRINGTATISQTKWDIHFDNIVNASPSKTLSGETNTGVVKDISYNGTLISSLKVDLKKPGDSVVYNFKIVNSGTIDAKLSNFTQTLNCESDNSCSYATYNIQCLDSSNNAVSNNSALNKNDYYNCTLNIKYNDVNIADDVSATLSANWLFTQK